MTGTDLFSQHLAQIKGVDGFMVLRNDGHILTHNMEQAEKLSSLATLCGISAQGVQKTMGFMPFRHLVFSREHNRSLLVFTLDKFYVGIMAKTGFNLSELIEDVSRFLFKIKIKKNSGHSPKEEG
jgi:predicted regulator of Ras-like GTPase activity (Roadblock/LC7/MglB family)